MPIVLYDEQGSPVEVPEGEIQQALSGGLGFAPGQRLKVRSPDGETYEQEASDAIQSLRLGWAVETPEEGTLREAQAAAGGVGGAIGAGAAGALESLSFGGTNALARGVDWATEALPGGFQTDIAHRIAQAKAAHPDIYMGGQILGGVAPLLMTGGAGTLGLLARATPAAKIASLGRAVEGGVMAASPFVTSTAGRILLKGAALGAGGAAEGAAWGAGEGLGASMLDPELSAERLMSHLGDTAAMGALWGGGLGAVMGSGFEALAEGVPPAWRFTKKQAGDAWDYVREKHGILKKSGAKVVTQADEAVERFMGKETVEETVDAALGVPAVEPPDGARLEQGLDLIPRQIKAAVPEVERQRAVRQGSWYGEQGRAYAELDDVAEGHKSVLFDEATVQKESNMQRFAASDASSNEAPAFASVISMLADAETSLDDMLGKGAGHYGAQAGISKLKKIIIAQREKALALRGSTADRVSELQEKLSKARGGKVKKIEDQIQRAQGEAVGSYMILGDQTKRQFGFLREDLNRLRTLGTADVGTMRAVEEVYLNVFMPGLENAGVWGKRAAGAQAEWNAKWSPYMRQIKGYDETIPIQVPWEQEDFGHLQKAPQGKRGKVWRADAGRAERFLKALGDNQVLLQEEFLNNRFRLEGDLLEVIEKHLGDDPRLAAGYKLTKAERAAIEERRVRLRHHLEAYKKTRNEQRSLMTEVKATNNSKRALAELEEGTALSGFKKREEPGLTGKIIGAMGLSSGVSAAVNPAKSVKRKATMDRAAKAIEQKVKFNVDKFFELGGKGLGKLRPFVTPLTVPLVKRRSEEQEKSRAELLRERTREISSLSVASGPVGGQLRKNLEQIAEVSPELALALEGKAQAVASFLSTKAPQDPTRPGFYGPQKSTWEPSDLELARFERYYRAATQPSTISEDLAEGDLSHEAAEVLRTVYPALHREIATAVLTRVQELGDEVPYQTKVMVSSLLGFPTDETLEPEFVAWAQEAYAPLAGPEGGPGPAPTAPRPVTQKALDRLEPDSYLTNNQRLAGA